MKTKKHDTRWMVSVALMAAIVIVLANTPLGMIQLPVIKATTVHIPVIIGAILLGPSAGAILGGVFGICSLISNTMAPTLLSFAFSPFMSTTGIPGALKAIWISVGCRILIGLISGWLWMLLMKLKMSQLIALPVVGFDSHGKYLPDVCKRVCPGKRSGSQRSMGTDHGNHHSVRYPGGDCGGSAGAGAWKSPGRSISKDEYPFGRQSDECALESKDIKNKKP